MLIKRTGIILKPDSRKVILKPLIISDENRIKKIISRIVNMTDNEIEQYYQLVLSEFGNRHKNIEKYFRTRFQQLKKYVPGKQTLSEACSLLIGAYFSHEYSIEAAALFNPSIVWHPDQSGLPSGTKRFILSLRATGEGHISSLTFRTGIIDNKSNIELSEPGRFPSTAEKVEFPYHDRTVFNNRIGKFGLLNDYNKEIVDGLGNPFKHGELKQRIQTAASIKKNGTGSADVLLNLLQPEYQLQFDHRSDLSERVVFPVTESESNGIEDARYVMLKDGQEDRYCATYTAYDGNRIRIKLIETTDFIHFRSSPLAGPAIENKGVALFPRKIDGKYAMLSRQDNENNHVMFSDDLYYWKEKKTVQAPGFPWEFIQLGNCGSPLETEAGWLVFSHGVGAMRKYSIGAFLLDIDDPTKLIGRTEKPLLSANESEREGYVPNVVYSCGAIIHNSNVVLPYAMSDSATSFALINLEGLLHNLINSTR